MERIKNGTRCQLRYLGPEMHRGLIHMAPGNVYDCTVYLYPCMVVVHADKQITIFEHSLEKDPFWDYWDYLERNDNA